VRNFPGPFRSPRMLKYEEKTPFTHNIRSIVHCRNCSMKQNVDCSCFQKSDELIYYFCLFSIKTNKKCVIFNIFPGLSRILSFNFQDFPGPKCFSRTFQVLEFSRTRGNPVLCFLLRRMDRTNESKLSRHSTAQLWFFHFTCK